MYLPWHARGTEVHRPACVEMQEAGGCFAIPGLHRPLRAPAGPRHHAPLACGFAGEVSGTDPAGTSLSPGDLEPNANESPGLIIKAGLRGPMLTPWLRALSARPQRKAEWGQTSQGTLGLLPCGV